MNHHRSAYRTIRHSEVNPVCVHKAWPADTVDEFRVLTIHGHANGRINLSEPVSWERLTRIDTRNGGAETCGFHDQDFAGLGGLCSCDGREV